MKNFRVYFDDELTASVEIQERAVFITRYILHPVKQSFPKDILTRYEFGEVLRLRCWEEKRDGLEKYLKALGLEEYDVYKICEKTHGVMIGDRTWFLFDGEDLTSEDVLRWKHEKH